MGPCPGKQSRRNAECNNVRKRIQFATEIARRASHSRDAAIESIEQNCKPDRLRCIVEVWPALHGRMRCKPNRMRDRAVNYLENGKEPK